MSTIDRAHPIKTAVSLIATRSYDLVHWGAWGTKKAVSVASWAWHNPTSALIALGGGTYAVQKTGLFPHMDLLGLGGMSQKASVIGIFAICFLACYLTQEKDEERQRARFASGSSNRNLYLKVYRPYNYSIR